MNIPLCTVLECNNESLCESEPCEPCKDTYYHNRTYEEYCKAGTSVEASEDAQERLSPGMEPMTFKWHYNLFGPATEAPRRSPTAESDPNGKDPHEPGAKLDYGKTRPGLIMEDFAMALQAVAAVGTYGADKYTDHGWRTVPNGEQRYTDAMYRHLLAEHSGERRDQDTQFLHAAHTAWNALARLELMLKKIPEKDFLAP